MMKNLFRMFAVLMVFGMTAGAFAVQFLIPLDAQINIGRTTVQNPSGDAIYWPIAGNIGSFESDEPEGYARTLWNPGGSWQYGPYVDFYLAGVTDSLLDLTAGGTLEFDVRVYNDPETNTNPYGDANIFVRMYSIDGPSVSGWRDFGLVYGPTGEDYYPYWTHITLDLESGTTTHANFDAGLLFDQSKIRYMRFYATNWAGHGDDFSDVKNLAITSPIPEPGTIAMFALGLLGLLATRRKK